MGLRTCTFLRRVLIMNSRARWGSWLWLQGADDNALVQGHQVKSEGKAVSELLGREARCFSRMLAIPLEVGRSGPALQRWETAVAQPAIFLPASGGRQTRRRPGPACEFADQSQSQKSR